MPDKKSLWYLSTHEKRMDRKEYFKLIRRVRHFVAIMLAASLAAFLGIAVFSKGGILSVADTIAKSNMYLYACAFLLVFLGYVLSFFKWRYYLKTLGIRIPEWKNFAVYMSLYSMELTPGRIGRVITAYTIKRISKKKFASVLPIVSLDIFTDYLGFIVLSLIVGVLFYNYLPLIITVDVLLLLPFVFILNPWLFNALRNKLLRGRFSSVFELYGEEYFTSQSRLNNAKVYVISLLFSVPSALLGSMALYFAMDALGHQVDLLKSVLVYVVSILVGILTFIPGAIGSADVTMTAMASANLHVSTTVAAAATILTRIASLWFGVVVGSIFLFYTFRYWFAGRERRKQPPVKGRARTK